MRNLVPDLEIDWLAQHPVTRVLEQNGVKFHDPDTRELATTRTAMIDAMAPLIKEAKLSPEIVKLVKEAVG